MPLIFTREYIIAIGAAIVVTIIAKWAGFRRGRWPLSTVVIILTLWPLGFHPLGFAVSWGGWIMLLLTVLIGRFVQAIVMATR